jgi:adenylate cyclase
MSQSRRLAAILAADVVGYSRLMGADGEGTLERLKALRSEIIDKNFAKYRGRIVKTTGDGLLVEFASVVDAVRCAAEVQQAVPELNAGVPAECRIELRIGINLGDVIADDDDLYGDGVNIAARIEALADAGGVFVSGTVYDQVRDRLNFGFEDRGEQKVKNIARPVRVYRVLLDDMATTATNEALPLPDKPSIAVLAFTNMSDDAEQEYFSDGVADDIITELSRNRSLFVIARNSSFSYRGRAVDVKLVARELGVRYVVEGSVRRSGTRVRIAAQLIEAETGNHIWAERYDRALEDVFAVQDEITSAVVTAIVPVVADTERMRALRKPPGNMNAWEVYQRGLWHFLKYTIDDNKEARSLFQKAAEIDTRFACAFAGMARTYFMEPVFFGTQSFAQIAPFAVAAARKAVELDPNDPEMLATLSNALALAGDDISAERYTERALALNPNNADALQQKGGRLIYAGQHAEGRAAVLLSLRLNPRDPTNLAAAGKIPQSYYFERDYQAAIKAARWCLTDYRVDFARLFVVAAMAQLGRQEEAQGALRDLLATAPGIFDTRIRHRPPYVRPQDHEHMLDGLRKAGWRG